MRHRLFGTAIEHGLKFGRNGRGTVYVWAAGNGATGNPDCPTCIDISNYDGLANYRGVIAVAAVDDHGKSTSYSERGANVWISAPAGKFCDTHTITTTDSSGDAGNNTAATAADRSDYANTNYTKCMSGTSAATPGVAGVIALMLEANPALGWRDVRLILAETARNTDPARQGWVTSAKSPFYHFHLDYGFGVVDAKAAVTRALTWVNVGPEITYTTVVAKPKLAIPDNSRIGVSHTIKVADSGITDIEFIDIAFTAADHQFSGELEVTLTSPSGTVSLLAEKHVCNNDIDPCTPYDRWVFGSARHLGEAANGNWTLTVNDLAKNDVGTFQSWALQFYGR